MNLPGLYNVGSHGKSSNHALVKIGIGIFYSGENEFEACLDALEAQSYSNYSLKVFKGLGNKEAHDALYSYFMSVSGSHDIFVKLDADMVLRTPEILNEIAELFARENELDHATFTVFDWYSQRPIVGLHAFSKRASWKPLKESLFVDHNPTIPGHRIMVWEAPSPVADHSPDTTAETAYLFGVHRALKIVQRGNGIFRKDQSKIQFEILRNIWREAKKGNDPRRCLVIVGAESVFRGIQIGMDKKAIESTVLEKAKEECGDLSQIYRKYRIRRDGLIYKHRYWRYVLRREKILQGIGRRFLTMPIRAIAKVRSLLAT